MTKAGPFTWTDAVEPSDAGYTATGAMEEQKLELTVTFRARQLKLTHTTGRH
jgi:hypothetical protein